MQLYTKLMKSMLDSTIWRQEDHVRILWITMLSMADSEGEVMASIPGLADRARITLEQCEEGLSVLSGPDVYSRTKDNDGRRVEEVDGGWVVLNYVKYRGESKEELVRKKHNERQKKYKERQFSVSKRQQASASVSDDANDGYIDIDIDIKKERHSCANSEAFAAFWKAYPKKRNKADAERAFKKAVKKAANTEVLMRALEIQKKSIDWVKKNGQYIPYPATWLNKGGWEDDLNEKEVEEEWFSV